MLIFDPDTTVESLRTNIAFIRYAAEFPSNFGRVELYAGTPLLARMQAEGRVTGDYLQWDYSLGDVAVERIFDLSMRAYFERNFGEDALANRIMGTRFDIEVCRHFHPDRFRPEWLAEGKELSRILAADSADGLDALVDHVEAGRSDAADVVALVTWRAASRASCREANPSPTWVTASPRRSRRPASPREECNHGRETQAEAPPRGATRPEQEPQ